MTQAQQNDPSAQAVRELQRVRDAGYMVERHVAEAAINNVITLFEQAQKDLLTMCQDRDDADKAREQAQRELAQSLRLVAPDGTGLIAKLAKAQQERDDLAAKFLALQDYVGQLQSGNHAKEVADLQAKCERAKEDRNKEGMRLRAEWIPKLEQAQREREDLKAELKNNSEGTWHKRYNDLTTKCERLRAKCVTKQDALKAVQRWLITHTDIEGENPLLDDVVSPAVHDDCGQSLLDEWKRFRKWAAQQALATPGKETA